MGFANRKKLRKISLKRNEGKNERERYKKKLRYRVIYQITEINKLGLTEETKTRYNISKKKKKEENGMKIMTEMKTK
jgi:hypothetical protein